VNVPTPIAFSTIPVAGVLSSDLTAFYMKTDPSTLINLASAAIQGGIEPDATFYYFPNAALTLG